MGLDRGLSLAALGAGLGDDVSIERLVTLRDVSKGEVGADVGATAGHHRAGGHSIAQQGVDAPSQAVYVAVAHEQASTGLADDLSAAAVVGHDHRGATQQALEGHQTKDLGGGGVHEHIGIGEEGEPLIGFEQPHKVHGVVVIG